MQRRLGTLLALAVIAVVAIAVWLAASRSTSLSTAAGVSSRPSARDTKVATSPAAEADAPSAAAGDAAQATDPTAQRSRTIVGRVIDGTTGDAIEGALVRRLLRAKQGAPQMEDQPVATTDPEGRFALVLRDDPTSASILEDIYLSAHKPGWAMHLAASVFWGRDPFAHELSSPESPGTSGRTLELFPAIRVAGKVRHADGRPVPVGQVVLTDGSGLLVGLISQEEYFSAGWPCNLAPDGTFELWHTGERRDGAVAVRGPGLKPFSKYFEVKGGKVEYLDIVVPRAGNVIGRVVDEVGKPVASAVIRTMDELDETAPSVLARSSEDGSFAALNVPPGYRELIAYGDGWAPTEPTHVDVPDNGTLSDVVLKVSAPKGVVAGVIELKDGRPVADLPVQVSHWLGMASGGRTISTLTDRKGAFRFEGMPNDVELTLAPETDWQRIGRDEVVYDDPDHVYIFDPPSMFTIRILVVDEETGAPVEQVRATHEYNALEPVIEDAALGIVRVERVVGRRFGYLGLSAPDYPVKLFSLDNLGIDEESPSGSVVEGIARLRRPGTIRGRVISMANGAPLSKVRVELRERFGSGPVPKGAVESPVVFTDFEGGFEFTRATPGELSIKIEPHAPYRPKEQEFTLSSGGTVLGEISLEQELNTRVRILGSDGRPRAGVRVAAHLDLMSPLYGSPELEKDTDGEGVAAFTLPPDDFEWFEMRGIGYRLFLEGSSRAAEEIVVPCGDATIDVSWTQNGSASKRECWVWMETRLPSGARLLSTFGEPDSTVQGPGSFRRAKLPPGEWEVTLRDFATPLTKTVTLRNGETTKVEFSEPTGRIIGQVVDDSGARVAGARVFEMYLAPNDGVPVSSDGTFVFPPFKIEGADGLEFEPPGLSPGSYDLVAGHEERELSGFARAVIPEHGNSSPVTIVLGKGGGGSLRATALHETTGEIIRHPRIQAKRVENERYFDWRRVEAPDGASLLPSLPPGEYKIAVWENGFSTSRHRVTIEAGKQVDLSVRLFPAADFKWTIVGANALPVEGINCSIAPLDPAKAECAAEGLTDSDGEWVAHDLRPGKYTAVAHVTGKSPIVVELDIAPGRSIERTTVVR